MHNAKIDDPIEAVLKKEICQWIELNITKQYSARDRNFNPGTFLIEHASLYKSVVNGAPKENPHECFHNASLKMLYDPEQKTRYVEGIVWHEKLPPFYHGWNMENGMVIDYTITPTEKDTYFGVVIPNHLVIKAMSNVPKTRQSLFGVLGTLSQYKASEKFIKELTRID